MVFKLSKAIEELTTDVINSIPEYLVNVIFDEHTLYHCSPFDILKYEHSKAVAIRKERDTHDNSVLGMWTSTYPELCSTFGQFTYRINYTKKLKAKGINLRLFYYLTVALKIKDILKLREEIMKECDILYIIDMTKSINEVIILDTESVTITKELNKIRDSIHNLKISNEM